MQLPGDGQLHGVIGPESLRLGQGVGVGQEDGRHLEDVVLVGGVVAELGEDGRGGGSAAASMPPRPRRVTAAVTSIRVMRARNSSWPAAGSARAWTQAVPISWTYRLTMP